MTSIINRPFFTNWLSNWRDKDVIKVVTGIRRCGKTTLLRLFREKLLAEGVSQNQIISINFEDPDVGIFRTFDDAWKFLRSKMDDSLDKIYIFLDEVQQVPEFERLVDGLFVKSKRNINRFIKLRLYAFLICSGGGIGRRNGLKIRWEQSRESSSLSQSTNI